MCEAPQSHGVSLPYADAVVIESGSDVEVDMVEHSRTRRLGQIMQQTREARACTQSVGNARVLQGTGEDADIVDI